MINDDEGGMRKDNRNGECKKHDGDGVVGNSADNEEEKVGYCKPSRRTQFKPGQSGNPKGRPKRSRSLDSTLDAMLDEKIAGPEGRVNFREYICKRVVHNAAKGEWRALKIVLDHMRSKPPPDPFNVTQDDDAELEKSMMAFMAKNSGKGSGGDSGEQS